ncbi:hypothetical protein [Streptomyces abikoensis]|uniref:hypothetical protein n=1 Tax=Streptomyces abikoensis TaxID=97398 RepID=UPI001671EB5A|nr:hypothetical protein [Streptomyces abikoensis]GGP36415.1 hypothetical protein GCM10010214_06620 [Streptomyces abikoensis]
MTEEEPPPHEQHNHGDGTFIGRDHYGDINFEMIDAGTKGLLEDISKVSPKLANLLAEALQDGIISPDVAEALDRSARNINEDVAHALWDAGRNINEDVAFSLTHASENINPQVANKISAAAEILSLAMTRLDIDELHRTIHRFESFGETLIAATTAIDRLQYSHGPLDRIDTISNTLSDAADRIERTIKPPPPKLIIDREAVVKAFFWGVAVGALLAFFLMTKIKGS